MNELGKDDFAPTWAKIKNSKIEGYVGARSLINPKTLIQSDPEKAKKRSDEMAGKGSGFSGKVAAPKIAAGGFSGKVAAPKIAAGGASGTPKLEGANYEAADQLFPLANYPSVRYRQANLVLNRDIDSKLISEDDVTNFVYLSEDEPTTATSIGDISWNELVSTGMSAITEIDPTLIDNIFADIENEKADLTEKKVKIGGKSLKMPGSDNPKVKMAAAVTKIVGELLASTTPTPADELYLAYEAWAHILAVGSALPMDNPKSIMVNAIGHQLAAHSTLPYPMMGYLFIVQENAQPGAWATPGGVIFITTGLLDFVKSDDELAAIIAHEITHVEERHPTKLAMEVGFDKLPKFREIFHLVSTGTIEALVDKMLAKVPDLGLPENLMLEARKQIIIQVTKKAEDGYVALIKAVINKMGVGATQSTETAADTRGMSLAAAAGYNPNALLGILERFKGDLGNYGGASYSDERGVEAGSIHSLLSYEASSENDSSEWLDSIGDSSQHEGVLLRAQPALSDTRVMLLTGIKGKGSSGLSVKIKPPKN